MSALKALEAAKYANGASVVFRDVDYNILTFKEQITIDLGGSRSLSRSSSSLASSSNTSLKCTSFPCMIISSAYQYGL